MCKTRPVTHYEVFRYLIDDWLESEPSDDKEAALKELVSKKEGIEKLYALYMKSDELLVGHDHITDMVGRLVKTEPGYCKRAAF